MKLHLTRPISMQFLGITLCTLLIGFVWFYVNQISIKSLPPTHPPGNWSLMGPQPPAPPEDGVRPRHPSMRGLGWQVIDYLSVQKVLVVNIDTHRLDEVKQIAREIIDPLSKYYAEILVYFREPNNPLASTRVQWTPNNGFIETDIAPITNN